MAASEGTTTRFETKFRGEDGEMHTNTDEMPLLGFGTYKVGAIPASATGAGGAQPELRPAEEVLQDAVKAGYTMFDCAQFYENEATIGRALATAGLKSPPFLTSKVWGNRMHEGPEAVVQQFEQTRKDLGVEFIHIYLIHWPVPGAKHVEAYKALQPLVAAGKIRHLGLSNYTIEDYQELMAAEGVTIKPVMNQIEINPKLYRQKTLAFFKSEGVHMQAYRGLGTGGLTSHRSVQEVAERLGRPASQVLGRWLVQQGYSHIPKSEKLQRMEENAKIFDFELAAEDMEKLGSLTTPESIASYKATYEKCIVRDTPMDISEGRKDYTAE